MQELMAIYEYVYNNTYSNVGFLTRQSFYRNIETVGK
jgi:hypothetical protein